MVMSDNKKKEVMLVPRKEFQPGETDKLLIIFERKWSAEESAALRSSLVEWVMANKKTAAFFEDVRVTAG